MKSGGRISVPAVALEVEPAVDVRARARRRTGLLAAVLGLGFVALAVRGAQLCVSPDDRVVTAGSVQRWEQMQVRARRGDIFDRTGRRLVTSVDSPRVVVDPARLSPEEIPELASQVAKILGLPPSEVEERMQHDNRYTRIASDVHPKAAQAIRDLDEGSLFVERTYSRYYPETDLAGHVLGFVDHDGKGRAGLEAALDDYLRGGEVLLQRRRDRRGLDVDRFSDLDRSTNRGLDVHTTIDRTIQRIAERALATAAEASEPGGAVAIVIDVETGDILALANWPTFNPNELIDDAGGRRNRAVQDAIEPGSVFKVFTISAAIEEGAIRPETLVDCELGHLRVGNSTIGDDHPKGVITVAEIVKYSNNIGTVKQALGLGGPTVMSYLHRFGFAERTGVPLPGERRGFLRDGDTVKRIELATTAYGQGATATPLQLVMAYAAIANGGVRMRPRLVTRVVDEQGVPEYVQEPEVAERVISEETAREMVEMMVGVTEQGGTARRAAIPGYRVAGKTGTAWKVEDGRYGNKRIGSFVGFVPADHPRLAIAIVVDEPSKGSRFGGIVAAPAFAEIAEASLHHLGIEPDPALLAEAEHKAATPVPPPEPEVMSEPAKPAVATREGDSWVVPDLRGRSLREALVALQGTGLAIATQGSGTVAHQDPPPGMRLAAGDHVSVVFQ